ncbi:hypothetical protein DITRI_Ditri02bG0200100 [Diplodiscus trichospermus]
MASTASAIFFSFSFSLSIPKRTLQSHNHKPITSLSFSNSFNPISSPKLAHAVVVMPKRSYRVLASDSTTDPPENITSSNTDSTIDIKLPRRSLLVKFTCGECGERTERLINRLAYERGLVYVQCAGCLQYHKLADNLGLVVDYYLKDEM